MSGRERNIGQEYLVLAILLDQNNRNEPMEVMGQLPDGSYVSVVPLTFGRGRVQWGRTKDDISRAW